MNNNDIDKITFNVTVYFQNGVKLQREVKLPKAYNLSTKENVIIPDDTECIEIRGMNDTLVIPLNMTFVINKSPDFRHIDNVSRYMLYRRDNGRCGYCGKRLSQKEATVDHIIPKSKGGKTTWNNVVLSCRPCNSYKDNRTPREAEMRLKVTPRNPKRD